MYITIELFEAFKSRSLIENKRYTHKALNNMKTNTIYVFKELNKDLPNSSYNEFNIILDKYGTNIKYCESELNNNKIIKKICESNELEYDKNIKYSLFCDDNIIGDGFLYHLYIPLKSENNDDDRIYDLFIPEKDMKKYYSNKYINARAVHLIPICKYELNTFEDEDLEKIVEYCPVSNGEFFANEYQFKALSVQGLPKEIVNKWVPNKTLCKISWTIGEDIIYDEYFDE